jgi:hypothetical protein
MSSTFLRFLDKIFKYFSKFRRVVYFYISRPPAGNPAPRLARPAKPRSPAKANTASKKNFLT